MNQNRNNEDAINIIIGAAAIIKWLRTTIEPTSRDWWYKWLQAIYPIMKDGYNVSTNDFMIYIRNGVSLANTLQHRHLILKKFVSFNDSEDLGTLLVILQSFIEIEKHYGEHLHVQHQKHLNAIFKDEFKEDQKKIKQIKNLARNLITKARQELPLDDIKAP